MREKREKRENAGFAKDARIRDSANPGFVCKFRKLCEIPENTVSGCTVGLF